MPNNEEKDQPDFKVERGVPIPDRRHGAPGKYPFEKMSQGDSFLLPVENEEDVDTVRRRIAAAASLYATRNGGKFTTRTVDGGIRVWRVE